jgi:hypothetical protein
LLLCERRKKILFFGFYGKKFNTIFDFKRMMLLKSHIAHFLHFLIRRNKKFSVGKHFPFSSFFLLSSFGEGE